MSDPRCKDCGGFLERSGHCDWCLNCTCGIYFVFCDFCRDKMWETTSESEDESDVKMNESTKNDVRDCVEEVMDGVMCWAKDEDLEDTILHNHFLEEADAAITEILKIFSDDIYCKENDNILEKRDEIEETLIEKAIFVHCKDVLCKEEDKDL